MKLKSSIVRNQIHALNEAVEVMRELMDDAIENERMQDARVCFETLEKIRKVQDVFARLGRFKAETDGGDER